jgi:Flp pilus assembly protein CpaB
MNSTVKNFIPIIISIVLGVLGMLLVKSKISRERGYAEKTVSIVLAGRDIEAGEEITDNHLIEKRVASSSVPQSCIRWNSKDMLKGQKPLHKINKGDIILTTCLPDSTSMGEYVGKGKWGVPVSFADSTLLSALKRGDEIAIIGVFSVTELVKDDKNVDAKPREVKRRVTAVLYPQVEIMDKIGNNAVMLSVPPDQALALVNVQEKCELYPVLRHPNDNNNLDRSAGGIFDDSAMPKIIQGLNPVEIPSSAKGLDSKVR